MRDRPDYAAWRTMPKSIEASIYNRARLALLRLGCPLRVEVPGHRGLEVILNDDLWLCVDANAEDQPVLAWFNFSGRRDNLHEPVTCSLDLYHRCAGLVMGSVIDALDEALAQRLHPVP